MVSIQLFHKDKRRKVLMPRGSVLGLSSSIRWDVGRTSVKLAWSVLHTELKARVLRHLEGNNEGRKKNTHTRHI